MRWVDNEEIKKKNNGKEMKEMERKNIGRKEERKEGRVKPIGE